MLESIKKILGYSGDNQSQYMSDILKTAFTHDIDSIILVDKEGVVQDLNQSAQKLFPHLNQGAQVKSVLRSPLIRSAFDDLEESDEPLIIVEFSLKVPNERNFHAIIIKDLNGYAIRLQDVTEQKRAMKMHGDFVANVSHEMRTPLASICGFIETLQGPAKGDPEAAEQFLGIMDAQAKRMKSLVDGLLSLSRIELNRHIAPTDRVELSSVMADVALAMEPIARMKQITVTFDGDTDNLCYAQGNRDELFQVIQNLTENAVKYSDEKTQITLKIVDKETDWALCVQDQGRGIDQAHIARLTERFYRVDDARNRNEGGAGLGLSIVSSILARHNAKLEVESEIGKGSVFMAIIPKFEG